MIKDKDKDLIDIKCVDNTIGDNSNIFFIGEVYKGKLNIDKSGNINYDIYQEHYDVNGDVFYRFKRSVTGVRNEKIYFDHISYRRNLTITNILK